MKAELNDISVCKKALDIEIPQDIVDNEITGIAKEFARKARVPGFRPGKARNVAAATWPEKARRRTQAFAVCSLRNA